MILTARETVLTWMRFREVDKATRLAVSTNNSAMAQRQHRVRKKLYLLALLILIPFLPVELLYLVDNLLSFPFPLKPYDFNQIHYGNNPYPFNFISFTTSGESGFIEMNQNYIAAITADPIFWIIGVTKEAINTYRGFLLALGLGRLFPKLNNEYDPDRTTVNTGPSWTWNLFRIFRRSTWTASTKYVPPPPLPPFFL